MFSLTSIPSEKRCTRYSSAAGFIDSNWQLQESLLLSGAHQIDDLMGSCFCIQNLSRKSNKSSTAYPLTVQIHTILCFPWGMGVGGTQQMFIRGGSAPRSNPLLFYIQFFKKKSTPFVYLLDIWYSFHIPCIELCIAFTFCKCTVK